jgi:hypothetical protein
MLLNDFTNFKYIDFNSYITLNNKSDLLKKSSTILLATVLVVSFIGISSPSSIFAQEYYDDSETDEYSQYYDDDYETKYSNYESYMKDEKPRPIIQKISCDNINNNPPISLNVGTGNEPESTSSGDASRSFSNGDSQSGQRIDRMNADGFSDQKGDFVYTCQNNNNLNVNVDISNEQQINPTLSACNTIVESESPNIQDSFNTGGSGNTAFLNATTICTDNIFDQVIIPNQPIQDNDPGVITASSIANVEQPSVQSQQIKSLQQNNGIGTQQKANIPIDIMLSQLSSQSQQTSKTSPPIIAQGIGDSTELTATEKITKLKQQWMELTP